ncbi:MAG TPA: DsrE family protein [Casimicrobiaceae bacterium]|jgi:intracellular sulfur oxidation DsrE/DsrF family protein|nr:DsrE family protein [Casimicrobiaceae bacterium]
MSRSKLSGRLVAAAAIVLFAAVAAAQTQQGTARSRVVIQVSDGETMKWNLALNNAHNLQAELGAANIDIEIVAYGPGIGMLKLDSPVANAVGEAGAAGMKIFACENTMRAQHLARSDMLDGIGYVSAGVVEIMKRQQQGWSYIRP